MRGVVGGDGYVAHAISEIAATPERVTVSKADMNIDWVWFAPIVSAFGTRKSIRCVDPVLAWTMAGAQARGHEDAREHGVGDGAGSRVRLGPRGAHDGVEAGR